MHLLAFVYFFYKLLVLLLTCFPLGVLVLTLFFLLRDLFNAKDINRPPKDNSQNASFCQELALI